MRIKPKPKTEVKEEPTTELVEKVETEAKTEVVEKVETEVKTEAKTGGIGEVETEGVLSQEELQRSAEIDAMKKTGEAEGSQGGTKDEGTIDQGLREGCDTN